MKFKVPDKSAEKPAAGLSKNEKTRLILMGAGLVVVVIALVTALMQGDRLRQEEELETQDRLPAAEDQETVVTVSLPEIDGAALGALVVDAESGDRVVLEPEAVELALGWARGLTDAHFAELGVTELDAEVGAELLAEPAERRGQAFRVRGGVESLERRSFGEGGQQAYLLRLKLDDDSHAYAIALNLPPGHASVGAFLRLDGLFVKAFSVEGPGGWIEAPLLVSPSAVVSYPGQGPIPELGDLLAGVEDDGYAQNAGVPFTPRWILMGHAAHPAAAEIDWEAVPLLDNAMLEDMLQDGEKYRGQPVRIDVSKLMDLRVKSAGENPARIDQLTEGWMGNTTWKNVIRFQLPGTTEDLHLKDLATARGFFLMNHAYPALGGQLRLAPFFVFTSLERFYPSEDNTVGQLATALAIGTVVLAAAIALLLARDRRRSRELQAEIVRRRQARRAKGSDA